MKFIDNFEDYIYFYDSNSEKFYKLNKHSKRIDDLFNNRYSNVTEFKIIHELKKIDTKNVVKKRSPNCDLEEYFLCKNNKCIHKTLICNGYDNCDDNSDEDRTGVCKNFTCKGPNQYDCGMNYCISNSKLCDL
jgi:hypothetical protein